MSPTMHQPSVIGRDLVSDRNVCLSIASRLGGLYVIGKTGRGKTNFLLSLILQDIYAGRGVAVIDPHGDLTVEVLAGIPAHRADDVYLLDVQDSRYPFALNLFAGVDPTDPESLANGAERIVAIFKKVWGDTSWGPRLEELLDICALTLMSHPGTTLNDFTKLLRDDAYRKRLLRSVTEETIVEFWEEYEAARPAERRQIYKPVTNKVRKFLRHPVLKRIVSQPDGTLDFATIMRENRILLVRLNPKQKEATALLGGVILSLLLEAAYARQTIPVSRRTPFMLYADEFQTMATSTFGQLLQEARKYGVATTLAHQLRSQLSAELQDVVKGAVCVVSFQLLTDDAGEMHREYSSKRQIDDLPTSIWAWAIGHTDPRMRKAAATVLASIPQVSVYDEEEAFPGFSTREKLEFFERRLIQAVKEGNPKATPYPSFHAYGVKDLSQGAYGRLADGFAVLRDRLLSSQQIDTGTLASLPRGVAAAKLELPDGSMRQHLLDFPLAIEPQHSLVVKTVFDHEEPLPVSWPEHFPPRAVAAGLRARAIRERNRRLYTGQGRADALPSAPEIPAETTPTVPTDDPPRKRPIRKPPIPQEADADA